jgi:hypothetical protein
VAERHDVPVVQMSIEFPGGFSSDRGRKAGTASFAMNMLDEGAGELRAIAVRQPRRSSWRRALGASAVARRRRKCRCRR